mmetsp:Transcript_7708/g.47715  ORF Transcript_7708/g.47715 Transcript_7708/m.47715 type:complete len:209 (+) Transcript_7708:1285-1911(+)
MSRRVPGRFEYVNILGPKRKRGAFSHGDIDAGNPVFVGFRTDDLAGEISFQLFVPSHVIVVVVGVEDEVDFRFSLIGQVFQDRCCFRRIHDSSGSGFCVFDEVDVVVLEAWYLHHLHVVVFSAGARFFSCLGRLGPYHGSIRLYDAWIDVLGRELVPLVLGECSLPSDPPSVHDRLGCLPRATHVVLPCVFGFRVQHRSIDSRVGTVY